MAAARGEIVITVQDGDAIGGQQPALAEGIERGVEECGLPAVEEIAGDHQMPGVARDDAIELPGELDRIGFISQVQV